MSKEAVIQIRIDVAVKENVEELYRSLGTSFAEAVRVFAVESLYVKGFPFTPRIVKKEDKTMRGILSGYANEGLRSSEKDAFRMAMEEKHEKTN